jgi:hypothetical protein
MTETRSHAENDHIAAGGASSPGKGRCRRQLDPPIETYPHPVQPHSLNIPDFIAGSSTGYRTLMSSYDSSGPPFASTLTLVLASPSLFPLPIPFVDGPPYSPSIPNSAGMPASGSPMLHTIQLPHVASQSVSCRTSSQLVPDSVAWSSV